MRTSIFRTIPIVIIATTLFAGCATTKSISQNQRTQVYDAPYEQVFKAAVQAFSQEGYSIEQADSETGVINTGYTTNSTLAAAFVGNSRTKLNAVVSEAGSTRTEIMLNITAQKKSAFQGWQAQSMSKSKAQGMYDEWFTRIGSQF